MRPILCLVLACCSGPSDPDGGDPGSDAGIDAASDGGMPLPDAGRVVRVVEGYTESAGPVHNADVGLYSWEPRDGRGLAFFHEDLDEYCNTATLPSSYLDALTAKLERARDMGQRVILRFRYAREPNNPCGRVDAQNIEIVEGHIAQLGPVIAANIDVIAYVEAGFLGQWGEWNDVDAPAGTALADSEENRGRVVDALLAAVPSSRMILLRRPRFRMEQESRLSADELARVGFHNDCFLASDTDYGTYDGALSPDEWKDYIHAATLTVPNGGETCTDTLPFTACDNAVPELERVRFSYLHIGYKAAVIQRWRDEGCFDEIERRLGHRLVLRRMTIDETIARGASLRADLELTNVGFAPVYGEREPELCLFAGGVCAALDTVLAEGALSDVEPGADGTVSVTAVVPSDLAPGSYELRIVWRDPSAPAFPLLFANEGNDETRRENVLATIEVE